MKSINAVLGFGPWKTIHQIASEMGITENEARAELDTIKSRVAVAVTINVNTNEYVYTLKARLP